MEIPQDLIKVWYDPQAKGYRFYSSDGTEVLAPGTRASLKIDDNWNGQQIVTATVELLVEVVNQKPGT